MTKKFAPRVSKKQRKTLDYLDRVDVSVLKKSDEKLLQGAKLNDVELKQITVKEQVRTKFNDKSIKELADNIEANGLIQPLV
ncbi:MAG: ParB N-terminal domain-containing protein, partial [Bdellovibrionales bacterium]|nr:ParB N-terminal domain-containing protein [Bdellovibrionales bacterium]